MSRKIFSYLPKRGNSNRERVQRGVKLEGKKSPSDKGPE